MTQRQEQIYIHQQLEPNDRIIVGNAKRYKNQYGQHLDWWRGLSEAEREVYRQREAEHKIHLTNNRAQK